MNKKLIPLKWNNQKIMTTKTLSECYETEEVRIQQGFTRNKNRFIEGKHYYKLTGIELKEFKANYLKDSSLGISKFASELILWTEKGALKHAKILDTDKAWEAYEWLEDTYFYVKEVAPQLIEERRINAIEDEKERNMRLKILQLKKVIETNPNDTVVAILLNQTNIELEVYLQNKSIKEIENKVDKFSVLREGDMNANVIAKKLDLYSVNNKPHGQLVEAIAKDIGIYVNPNGNVGYQNEYVSVNLCNVNGQTIPTVMYTEKAFNDIKSYINNGLDFEVSYYKRGENKGKYNKATVNLVGKNFSVNEITYKKYKNN